MEDHHTYREHLRRVMFDNGIPVGSDDPLLQLRGSPPIHLCDPCIACDLCGRNPTGASS